MRRFLCLIGKEKAASFLTAELAVDMAAEVTASVWLW